MNMFPRLTSFLFLLLVFGALQANADTIYEINGTLHVAGNSANPGVGETIKYSFELDYTQALNDPFTMPSIVGTPIITSSGPLGTFSIPFGVNSQDYIGFFSPVAEIDLLGDFLPFLSPNSPVPTIVEPWLFSCSTTKGLNNPVCAPFYTGLNIYGTASGSVGAVATPEPGTLYLFLFGALALCLMKKILAH
jgi:hypothetical protein